MNATYLLAPLLLAQAGLGARVLARMAATTHGEGIALVAEPAPVGSVSVIVPVLDERQRLAPCLDGLLAQGAEVREVLVVDGGSRDGTQALVAEYAARDARLRLLDASPVPADWNGKAWGLEIGLRAAAAEWVLTIDADVRPTAPLARSLVAHAQPRELDALSVATRQRLATVAEGLVHPALLTTLVYRFGAPGRVARRVSEVQANGQCFLARRAALDALGGFGVVRDSICEDLTLARALVAKGQRVGFYEAGDLVAVAMYTGWRDAWRNWTRSLPLRDRYSGAGALVGLLEVALVQALPLPLTLVALAVLLGSRQPFGSPLWLVVALVNGVLALARLGVLWGTARAYHRRPWTYWLSPLCDLPVAVQLWVSLVQRRHVWRGRVLVRGGMH